MAPAWPARRPVAQLANTGADAERAGEPRFHVSAGISLLARPAEIVRFQKRRARRRRLCWCAADVLSVQESKRKVAGGRSATDGPAVDLFERVEIRVGVQECVPHLLEFEERVVVRVRDRD